MAKDRAKPVRQNGNASGGPVLNLLSRINVTKAELGPSARSIADVVLTRPAEVMDMSVTQMAAAASVSEGSVINFCRQVGLSGYQQLKLSLAQDLVQPVQFIQEDLDRDDNTAAVTRKMFHAGIQALHDTLSVIDPDEIDRAADAIRAAKRIEVYGIGSSAPIAEDACYRMLRIGLNAKAVTDSHVQAISASLTDADVATLTISHSGATHETVTSTRLAKEHGATTIVVTNLARSPIQAYADIKLVTMSRETRFRTEAMTSRIAQLCAIDALIAALALHDYDRAVETLKSTFDVLSIKRF